MKKRPSSSLVIELSGTPVGVYFHVKRGRIRLTISYLTSSVNFRQRFSFSEAEGDAIVRDLAQSLDYEVPARRRVDPPITFHRPNQRSLLMHLSLRMRVIRGKQKGSVLLILRISRHRALQVLKKIAPALGWELTEE